MTPTFADDSRLLALIARLKEPERRAVQLRFLVNLSLPEIASEMGLPPAEVTRLLLKGLQQVREALEE